jgi:hypothetical protein
LRRDQRGLPEGVEGGKGSREAHPRLASALCDVPAGYVHACRFERVDHIGKGEAKRFQAVGVYLYLDLALFAAEDTDTPNAGNPFEAGAQGVVDDGTK